MNDSRISRRALIINGSGIAAAGVVLAACSQPDPGLGRIGDAPATTALESEPVTDLVLLRTAQSVENLAVTALTHAGVAGKASAEGKAALEMFVKGHKANLERLAPVVSGLGGTSVTEPNEKMMTNYVTKAVDLIAGSDEPETDVLVFATALEALVAATYQSFVAWANSPALRSQMMSLALDPSQFSVAAAQLLHPGSKGVVPAVDKTGAPIVSALPTAFGELSSIGATIGKPNEAGVKATVNMETPSLNSLSY